MNQNLPLKPEEELSYTRLVLHVQGYFGCALKTSHHLCCYQPMVQFLAGSLYLNQKPSPVPSRLPLVQIKVTPAVSLLHWLLYEPSQPYKVEQMWRFWLWPKLGFLDLWGPSQIRRADRWRCSEWCVLKDGGDNRPTWEAVRKMRAIR